MTEAEEAALNLRSIKANARYWAAIIPNFQAGYLETQGEPIGKNRAHDFLKAKFLEDEFSTRNLSRGQFYKYVDFCEMWIAKYFHIVIEDQEKK